MFVIQRDKKRRKVKEIVRQTEKQKEKKLERMYLIHRDKKEKESKR
jgi:hypothetical protein